MKRRHRRRADISPSPASLPPGWGFLAEVGSALGLAAVGVAPALPVEPRATESLRRWLDRGFGADMSYMARHSAQRSDPSHPGIVDGASAVISVALPYSTGARSSGLWRHVAAHARGRDYHETLRGALDRLAGAVDDRFSGCECRSFVDTAPIMERYWAAAARVGSPGKHGGIIVPGFGARVVLGEIVCSGVPQPELEPAAPMFDACGECTLCMEACPTGALVEPGVVDSRRCLSYQTVENRRGSVPAEIAAHMDLVFGCDRCLSACPLESPQAPCALEPPPDAGPEDLSPAEIAEMDDDSLSRLIAGTCLERTGAAAVRRNARLIARAR